MNMQVERTGLSYVPNISSDDWDASGIRGFTELTRGQ
jgi:hypothetical protein